MWSLHAKTWNLCKVDSEPSRLTRLQRHYLVTTPLTTTHHLHLLFFLLFFFTQKLSCTFPRWGHPRLCYYVSNTPPGHLHTRTSTLLFLFVYALVGVGGEVCLGCWEQALLLSAQPILIPNKGGPQRKKDLLLVSFLSLLFQTYNNNKPDESFFLLSLLLSFCWVKILLIKYNTITPLGCSILRLF